jgi:hypothetical protein
MSTSSDTLMAGPLKNLSRAASRTSVPMPINMDIGCFLIPYRHHLKSSHGYLRTGEGEKEGEQNIE